MNYSILDKEVQDFIRQNQDEDPAHIALSKSPFEKISSRELAEQIDSRKRCEKKLPGWFNTPGIYYPPKLAIEQASSELTARYKAGLIKGTALIDLTGGFGADDFFFADKAGMVLHCERNTELSLIAKHNASILGAGNIQFIHTANSLKYLAESVKNFGTLYVDPSRRILSRKVFKLEDCEPDVVNNLELLQSKAGRIIIKTSPLLDIQSGLQELKNVKQVHVISVKNECKELLWVIDNNHTDEPEIICAGLGSPLPDLFYFKQGQEKAKNISNYYSPLNYIYEPDVALLKAGAFKLTADRFDLKKLDQHTHLYTSEDLKKDFFGRVFHIEEVTEYRSFNKERTKANIICRNFPMSPDQIRKKHFVRDGSEEYLIFTTACSKLIVIQANRIK